MIVENDRKTTITADLVVGHKYEVVVRAMGPDGTMQPMESSARNTIVIAGKTATPSIPSALTATGFLKSITLTWTNPLNYDLDRVEIWRSATNSRSTATMLEEAVGTTYIDAPLAAGLTRYYWIRAVNTSGIASSFYPSTTAGVGATALGVAATDIDDFAVTATKIFTNTIILSADVWTNGSPVSWNAHKLTYGGAYYTVGVGSTASRYITWTMGNTGGSGTVADPYLTTYAGAASYTYAANKFNIAVNEGGVVQLVWNSSANMVIGSAFILDAAIIEAKIDNLAVTNAKIALLAVDTAQIAALAVETAKIDNLAVTDAKINTLTVAKLTAGSISSKDIVLAVAAGTGDCAIRAGKTDFTNTDAGFIIGLDDSDSDLPKLYIGDATTYFNWTGAALAIKGNVTITGGSGIASLSDAGALAVLSVIGNAYITDLNVDKLTAGTISSKSIVLAVAAGTGDTEIRAVIATGDFANAGAASGFILGLDDSDLDKAKFYIGDATHYMKWDGAALTVNGSTVSDPVITGVQAGSEIAIQGWQSTLVFSSTDADTVAWASGVITLLDGTTYNITGANTGNMAALTYIYLDIGTSITLLQITTTAATAVGTGKILVAVAQNNSDATSDAPFQVFGGSGGNTILVDNIAANSASVNEFVSNTAQIKNLIVTDAKINTLTANKLTAGTIDASVITVTNLNASNISTGTLTGIAISIGAGNNIFKADANGIYLGHATFASAPFRVTMAGALVATNAAISGAITASTIDIGGDDATSFHVDTGGGIWSGASIANKATAPFRVSNAGAIVATSATITGTIQTAAAGQRIITASSDNTLRFHTATTENVIVIDDDIDEASNRPGIKITDSTNGGVAWIYKDATNNTFVLENRMFIESSGTHSLYYSTANENLGAGMGVFHAFVETGKTGGLFVGYNGASLKFAATHTGVVYAASYMDAVGGLRIDGTEVINSSKAIVGVTGITVASGDIVLSGANATVDSRDVSVDGAKLDGIAPGAQPGTVTAVTGSAPVVSSGGTTPAISMLSATAARHGYMTLTYAGKLDGIAAGATVGMTPAAHAADAHTMTIDGVDVSAHAANTTTPHGATHLATASKIVVRDASGDVLCNGVTVDAVAGLDAIIDFTDADAAENTITIRGGIITAWAQA